MRNLLGCSIALLVLVTGAGTTTAQLAPPFGGVPAGGSVGVQFLGGGLSGGLGLNLGQTSSRSITSTSASVTTMDGFPGFISNTVTRPFVTGVVPIVGDYPQPIDHQSIFAERNQQAWDRARRSQTTLRNQSLDKYLRRAYRAQQQGDKKMARANYRRAIRLANEPLRTELVMRMNEMLRK